MMSAPPLQNEGAGGPNSGAKHPIGCDDDCALRFSLAQLWSMYENVCSGGAYHRAVGKLCASCKNRWDERLRRWRVQQLKRKREEDHPGPQANNASASSSSRGAPTTKEGKFKAWLKRQMVARYQATSGQDKCVAKHCKFPALSTPEQQYCRYHSKEVGQPDHLHANTATCSRTFPPKKKRKKRQPGAFPIQLPDFGSATLPKRPYSTLGGRENWNIHAMDFEMEDGELDKVIGRSNLAFLNQEHVEMTPMLDMVLKNVDDCDTLVRIACLRTEVDPEHEAFYSLLEACTAACMWEAQALEESAAAPEIARLQNNHLPDARSASFISSKRVQSLAKVAYHLLLVVHHWRRFEQFPDESHSLSIHRWWLQNNKQGLQTNTPNDHTTFTRRDREAKRLVWKDLWSAAFYRDGSLTRGFDETIAEDVVRGRTMYDSWFITLAQSYLLHVDPHATPPQVSASLNGATTIQGLTVSFEKLLKILMLRKSWKSHMSRTLGNSDDVNGLWLRKSPSFVEVAVLGNKARRELGSTASLELLRHNPSSIAGKAHGSPEAGMIFRGNHISFSQWSKAIVGGINLCRDLVEEVMNLAQMDSASVRLVWRIARGYEPLSVPFDGTSFDLAGDKALFGTTTSNRLSLSLKLKIKELNIKTDFLEKVEKLGMLIPAVLYYGGG